MYKTRQVCEDKIKEPLIFTKGNSDFLLKLSIRQGA